MEYRRNNIPTGYTENHHIIPKSMGGTDEPDNLVLLTGREHWVAHLLLFKIYRNKETSFACHMMAMRCEERGIPQVRNSRMYEAIRIICANNIGSLSSIHQKGDGNSQYGTMWISNPILKTNIKIKKDENIPEGWLKGRNCWNITLREKRNHIKKIKIKKITKFRQQRKQKEYYKNLYNIMIEHDLSLREMTDSHYDKSHVALYRNFKKFGFL